MENPKITLSIDDGPKKGETLDRCPGNLIRIGRVVRGNTIAIKDTTISQKHLTVTFLPEICQWAVTDLGSANGTIINGDVICPNAPAPLADGDIIKIGQSTFMSVKISALPSASLPRTRRGLPVTVALAVSKENEEVEENEKEEAANRGGKRKPRGKACAGSAGNSSKDETLVPMRALTMACSARRSKEQMDVRDNADESAKICDRGRARRKRASTCTASLKNGRALEPVEVQLNSVSMTRVNNSTKDVTLVPMAEEGKKRRTTRALTVVDCSARHWQEQLEIEKNPEEPAKHGVKAQVWHKKRGVSAGASKCDRSLDFVVMEENSGRKTRVRETSARVLKDKGVANLDEPTKKGGKGNTRSKRGVESTRSSRKEEVLKPVDFKVVGEELEIIEKVKYVAKDGVKGRIRTKRDLGSARVPWKGEVLESLAVQRQQGRVTRSSKIVMDKSALVSRELEEEDKENKVVKVQEPAKNERNQQRKGKQSVRFALSSRKDEALKPVASSAILLKDLHENQEMCKLNMDFEALDMTWKKKLAVEHNFGCQGQKLAVEVENNVDNMISSESNSGEKYFSENSSWSSFSNVRGIPNTTSKYREDKLINFHATPFEVRVERAMNRGMGSVSEQIGE